MKIMPLTIINIFAVMEIIGLANQSVIRRRRPMGTRLFIAEVIQYFWIATLTLAMTSSWFAGTVYFLAMIMAKSLFLVFGIILILAFYLIEKLKKINLCQRIALAKENKNEENSSNNSSFAHGSKHASVRFLRVSDWITFLTDGNRFEAKLDQLGFTLGNDTIKGTFGFHTDKGNFGDMLLRSGTTGDYYNFVPTISMGLGYTSSIIGIGVGYNATIGPVWDRYNGKTESKKVEAVVHTPVLVLNALDNAFRMAIPIQVVHLTDKYEGGDKGSVTAVSLDAQFRYYTGIEALTQVRLYLKYGNYGYNYKVGDTTEKGKYAESFGFDLRFYFGSMVEEVALQPIVKLAYNGALGKQHNVRNVTALGALDDSVNTMGSASSIASSGALTLPTSTYGGNAISATWGQNAWDLQLMLGLGLTANSDIVSLYLEPQLGLKVVQAGSDVEKIKEAYGLGYNVYAEIYITPLKNLEWYFEAEIGNALNNYSASTVSDGFNFSGTTGVTWYLPAL